MSLSYSSPTSLPHLFHNTSMPFPPHIHLLPCVLPHHALYFHVTPTCSCHYHATFPFIWVEASCRGGLRWSGISDIQDSIPVPCWPHMTMHRCLILGQWRSWLSGGFLSDTHLPRLNFIHWYPPIYLYHWYLLIVHHVSSLLRFYFSLGLNFLRSPTTFPFGIPWAPTHLGSWVWLSWPSTTSPNLESFGIPQVWPTLEFDFTWPCTTSLAWTHMGFHGFDQP